VTLLIVLIVAVGIVLGLSRSRHNASASNLSSNPPSSGQSWANICAHQTSSGNSWTYTDGNGNSSHVKICGYTVTGEDPSGNSAPAGAEYINIVLEANDDQSDRGTDVEDNNALIALSSTTCDYSNEGAWDGDYQPSSSACIEVSGSFYDLTPTGGVVLDNSPSVQPGQHNLYVLPAMVPTQWVTSGSLQLVTTNNAGQEVEVSGFGAGQQSMPVSSSP